MLLTASVLPFAALVLKSCLIILTALVVVRLLRRASAAMRCAVWTTALYAVLFLPLATWLLPSWRLGWFPRAPQSVVETTLKPITSPVISAQAESVEPQPQAVAVPAETGYVHTPALPAWAGISAIGWPRAVFSLWLAVTMLLLVRVLVAQFHARRLSRSACAPKGDALPRLTRLLATELGLRRPVRTALCPRIQAPLGWGYLRPVILLPMEAEDWSEERLRPVLIHELAHIKRGDVHTHLIAQLTGAVWWFNPLVRILIKGLIDDRERACDDHVLLLGTSGPAYAGHLVAIARQFSARGSLAAAVSMAHHSQLEGRLMSILDRHQKRQTQVKKHWLIPVLAACMLLPLIIAHPGPKSEPEPAPYEPTAPIALEPMEPAQDEPKPRVVKEPLEELNEEQERVAAEAGLAERFSERDIRYIFANEIDLDTLDTYRQVGGWGRFSTRDLHYLIDKGVTADHIEAMRKARLLDRFSARDIFYLLAKEVPLDFIEDLREESLLNRYSARDMQYLYEKKVSLDYLVGLRDADLINRYSGHDVRFLSEKQVPIEYLDLMNRADMINRWSAHDVHYLYSKNVDIDKLAGFQEADIINRFSAHDTVALLNAEVPIEHLEAVKDAGLINRFSAHDLTFMYKEGVDLTYLDAVNEIGLINRFSAHDLHFLSAKQMPMDYLQSVNEAGYIDRFSAHDLVFLQGSDMPVDHLDEFGNRGLINDLSAYSIEFLYRNPVPFDFITRLKQEHLLRYFDGEDLHHLHRRGVTLDEIRDAESRGLLSKRYKKTKITDIFP
ncbi:MAG: M56 family metallopeptidase [Acidobacteriota bacterium]|nr:M56 family metallopeptidase [Acidobacteriota bacterium]